MDKAPSTQTKSVLALKKLNEKLAAAYECDTNKPAFAPVKTLATDMVAKVKSFDGLVLVISDLGLLFVTLQRFKHEGRDATDITFIAHTEEVKKLAVWMSTRVKVVLVCYNELKKWFNKNMNFKFDVIMMNPPYGSLHLPILKKAVESLSDDGICISVQPVRWLQDPLWRVKKTSDARKMQTTLGGKIQDIQIIGAKEATELFSAAFSMDLAIFQISAKGGNYKYDAPSSIRFGADLQNFAHILNAKSGFKVEHFEPSMEHFVPLMIITGALGSSHGFESCWVFHRPYGYVANGKTNFCKYGNGITLEEARKNNKRASSGKLSNLPVKSFNTAEEAKNFFEFIKLESFRFFVYVTTLDVNIQCGYLPIPTEVDAFVEPWTDEKFFKHFNINVEGQNIIKKAMNGKTDDQFGWAK